MKTFQEFVNESVIDIPKNTLDVDVFDFYDDRPPTLKASIRHQIAHDLHDIEEYIRVKRFFMVGSILTKQYTANSDIDISVDVDKEDINDILQSKVLKYIQKINGRLAIGTSHPINYYINTITGDEIDEERFIAIYDIINEKWVKTPKDPYISIDSYLDRFENVVSRVDLITAKLRRDIIDFKELVSFDDDQINELKNRLQSKMYIINKDIERLIDFKKTIKKKHNETYSRPLTPDEIEKYHTKNHLPINVVYKLLQKYYYWDFIGRLEVILGEDNKAEPSDIKDLIKVKNKFMGESFQVFVEMEDTKVQEKPIVKKKESPNLKPIRNREDGKPIADSRRGKPLHTQYLQKFFDAQVVPVTPINVWGTLTPERIVDMIVKAYPPMTPITDQESAKRIGNTGILIRKIGNRYTIQKP